MGKSILYSILYVVGFVIKTVYGVLFGWWLNPVLIHLSENKLKLEIRRNLTFLFDDFGARFIPGGRKSRRGKSAWLVAENVKIRIAWDRGKYVALVSPLSDEGGWTPIEYALAAINSNRLGTGSISQREFSSLSELCDLVKPQFRALQKAFENQNFPLISERVKEIEELAAIETSSRIKAIQSSATLSVK